uniref:Uncharacterized protein n=1 Tax=Physcomitrium patens TaxID=3218 RepID=A0A2K1K860_PHYPA|nr:hypothetical protein PHYPA_011857 [Physcomitrium patens]
MTMFQLQAQRLLFLPSASRDSIVHDRTFFQKIHPTASHRNLAAPHNHIAATNYIFVASSR